MYVRACMCLSVHVHAVHGWCVTRVSEFLRIAALLGISVCVCVLVCVRPPIRTLLRKLHPEELTSQVSHISS